MKTARGDDLAIENLSKLLGCNGCLPVGDFNVAFDAWFNDMQIGKAKRIQLLSDIGEQRGWITVPHAVPCSCRSNSQGGAIAAEDRCHRVDHFQQEARTVLDRSAIGVGSMVAVVLKELVEE